MMLTFVICMYFLYGLIGGDKHDQKYEYFNVAKHNLQNVIKPSEKVLKRVDAIAKSDKIDQRGWINIANCTDTDFRYINIELKDGKVMCNEGNHVVSIKVKGIENVSSNIENNAYLLHVDYGFISPKAKTVNPLPIIKKGWNDDCDWAIDLGFSDNDQGSTSGRLFGDNFEGYLVCHKAGDQALLVPKTTKGITFRAPQWTVAVDISMHRNPLASFGRQYKITILDNVDVLENGKKSFVWPSPLGRISDAYIFHKMMEKKKKKMCFLERDAQTFDVNLYCEDWGFKLRRKNVNKALLVGWGVMNVGMLAYSKSVKPSMTSYTAHRTEKPSLGLFAADVNLEGTEAVLTDRLAEAQYVKENIKDTGLNLAKGSWIVLNNLVYLLLWGSGMLMWSTALYFRLLWELRQMDKALDKVNYVYPWALENPIKKGE